MFYSSAWLDSTLLYSFFHEKSQRLAHVNQLPAAAQSLLRWGLVRACCLLEDSKRSVLRSNAEPGPNSTICSHLHLLELQPHWLLLHRHFSSRYIIKLMVYISIRAEFSWKKCKKSHFKMRFNAKRNINNHIIWLTVNAFKAGLGGHIQSLDLLYLDEWMNEFVLDLN